MRRILITLVLTPIALAGCALSGRKIVSPYADAPSLVDVAALSKFNGQLPLVTIPEGTQNWAPSVSYAVTQALKINPKAQFRVYVTGPASAIPSDSELAMAKLTPEAAQVADAIAANGVIPPNVSLGASTKLAHVPAPAGPEIVVFAK
ncbi:hypothetical protein [Acidiphilium acidophilum]|uniref:Lipoprotein n=1 Tax=Acidiphilium acidophilum TaxID=76588 RepID=A0AAW9DSF1_ACIAO|nr:hypothetical protein [Acidiphilium acidophilum]MDX5931561.1 hypothetical protein [Acidiphilium acidophilum]GBR76211.1 hypothetical protein AA700_0554 [Acidiphilium acidophilum DSM 700]